jgi:hypothetical protein
VELKACKPHQELVGGLPNSTLLTGISEVLQPGD